MSGIAEAAEAGVGEVVSFFSDLNRRVRWPKFWEFAGEMLMRFEIILIFRVGITWRFWRPFVNPVVKNYMRANWKKLPLQQRMLMGGMAGLGTFLWKLIGNHVPKRAWHREAFVKPDELTAKLKRRIEDSVTREVASG